MSLAPITNHPISGMESVIEIVGGRDDSPDEAFITTTIQLSKPIAEGDEPVTLILPGTQDALQQPIARWITESVDDSAVAHFDTVDRPDQDTAVIEAFQRYEEMRKAAEALEDAIEVASTTWSTTVLRVQPGQDRIRFFTAVAVPRAETGEFTFATLSPLASFSLSTGGALHVVAVLPSGSTLSSVIALSNPADPNSTIPVDQAVIAQRPVAGFFFQNDPLFKLTYTR